MLARSQSTYNSSALWLSGRCAASGTGESTDLLEDNMGCLGRREKSGLNMLAMSVKTDNVVCWKQRCCAAFCVCDTDLFGNRGLQRLLRGPTEHVESGCRT